METMMLVVSVIKKKVLLELSHPDLGVDSL